MQYPILLSPTEVESIALSTGSLIRIPKATPRFHRWTGAPPGDTYGGKVVLDFDGKPVFAELAILRIMQADGWNGVWVDTYSRKYRVAYWGDSTGVVLPRDQEEFLETIHAQAGTRNGCWDVFCWKDGDRLLAESKHSGKDRIRKTQIKWLAAALDLRVSLSSFLVVEWSLTEWQL
jgi:hypothetical protein